MGCVCLLGTSQILKPWTQIGRHHLISHPTLIFSRYLLLNHSSHQTPALQNVIERKTMQSNVETLNCLELVVHLMSVPAGSIKNFKYLSCTPPPVNFLQYPETLWHIVWEP